MENLAKWLNESCSGLDGGVFAFMHNCAENAGDLLTPLSKLMTAIGEKGLLFFGIAIIFMLFAKTRKAGICIFGAVACGALITNIILKGSVMRERPFLDAAYEGYWKFVGSPFEDDYCFPSGHATAMTAFAVALFIMCNKKWSWVGFIGVIGMGFARVYLIAHYFTDVLAGVVVGAISGVAAWLITLLIYKLLHKYEEKKFCKFVLTATLSSWVTKDKGDEKKHNK